MSLSNNLHMYTDVKVVLDAAVDTGGGLYKLATPGAATKWRQRAYQLRKIMSKGGNTPYDRLILTISPDDKTVVQIRVRQPEGEFVNEDGEVVSLGLELDNEAERVLRKQSADLMEDILKGKGGG